MALVIDASIAATWCFPDEHTEYTNAVLLAVRESGAVVPRLWAYELRNSILVGLRRNRITKSHAEDLLYSISVLPVRLTDPVSYDRVFELAHRQSLTVYDAAYVDVAMQEGLRLATLAGAQIRAARTAGVNVFQPG